MKNRLRPALIALATGAIVGVGVPGAVAGSMVGSAALGAALSDVGTSHTTLSAAATEHGCW